MNRQEKDLLINELKKDFKESKASFLVNYKGLSVANLQSLRKELKLKNGEFKVAKTRLVKLAIQDLPSYKPLAPFLKEQLAVVFSKNDPSMIAKTLNDFAKEKVQFQIVIGSVESQIVDKDGILAIASLPSREILLAQLCGTLNAPISRLHNVAGTLLKRLVIVLKQVEEKKN